MKYRVLWLMLIWLSSCGESSDRYEQLTKLRALGASSDTTVAVPSTEGSDQVVNLTVHAAVPKGADISAEVYLDARSLYTILVPDLEIVAGSESYIDYEDFRHYTLAARFTVPNEATLKSLGWNGGSALLRYGVKLTSGSEEEKIVGDVALDAADSEAVQVEWGSLQITSFDPTEGSTLVKSSEIDLKAVVETGSDKYKYGWFVTSGEVDNRRSLDTKWTLGDKTKQTLILTVRGKVSKSFDIKIVEYETQ